MSYAADIESIFNPCNLDSTRAISMKIAAI